MIDNDIEAIKKRTEKNRKAIPKSVLNSLSKRNISLDDVLKMTRQEFEGLNKSLSWDDQLENDRIFLINFKHDSMTHNESLIYFEQTDEDIRTAEMFDPDFRESNR